MECGRCYPAGVSIRPHDVSRCRSRAEPNSRNSQKFSSGGPPPPRPGLHPGPPWGLKIVKKPWFLRHVRFIGYLDIIHHIKDRIITIFGPSWAILGPSWAVLGPSWGDLGRSWGHLGAILGACWAILGPRTRLKTIKKPWFLRHFRFIGQLQAICVTI